MPLPTIVTPKYPITIPSSKKKTTYRPFLMKEQKILYSAIESEDQQQIFNAMCIIIRECVEGIENPETLPVFDLEYIFLRIRAKSVGEIIDVNTICPKCDAKNKIQVNLETIEVEFPENHSNKIMFTDKIGVMMKYPQFDDSLKNIADLNGDGMLDYICGAIDVVFDDSMTYTRKDFTIQELKDFVESLNTTQFEQIAEFYRKRPQLTKHMVCNCSSCKQDYNLDFRGMNDFFI
jgi:hypothetical protein